MSDVSNGRVAGRVKFYDSRKGYGFIIPDDGGKDVFIGVSFLPAGTTLVTDARVTFVRREGKRGLWAKDVQLT